jgi:carbamoyl-phosphate synthase large subunit
MLGKKISDLDIKPKTIPHFGVKEAVFPFNMFPEVDPILGPEMRSTGEVLGSPIPLGSPFTRPRRPHYRSFPRKGRSL